MTVTMAVIFSYIYVLFNNQSSSNDEDDHKAEC